MTDLRRYRPGYSPFDDIMHEEEDGTQWWSAREMMPYLGYVRWENMLAVIERARVACRNSGHDHSTIFRDATKYSEVVRKTGLDIQMLRFGCYLVALNGDPNKPEIAAAQRYFAVMTRAAELRQATPPTPPPAIPRSWSERFKETLLPHVRYVNLNHPGHFTVITTLIGPILALEDELVRHLLKLHASDRPDISFGLCWGNNRRERGLAPVDRRAPLYLPDQGISIDLWVYDNAERGEFETWFARTYLPEKLPAYLGNKPEFRPYGELPPASVADNTCLGLTGQHAKLRPHLRKQLTAVGGYFPAGAKLPQLGAPQRTLFDLSD